MLKRDKKDKKKKIRRHQPSRPKLEAAISEILDKAINAESANAPKQLHLILTTEHPEWKLPERRVAKYLKRKLKDKNDPKFNDIDADLDEASIYSSTSTSTWRTKESVVKLAASGAEEEADEKAADENDEALMVDTTPATADAIQDATVEKKLDAYEDDEEDKKGKGKDTPMMCDGCTACIIS
mmetsp:Transcript_19290/g.28119  ORF Transcript_19290/g.28119 Transcript_19290/m.28119 type:complete len:183 (+) Transcript_19290:64-612(+)